MTIDELRTLLADLPGDGVVMLVSLTDLVAYKVEDEMSPARFSESSQSLFDWWNDNDEDAATYSEARPSGEPWDSLPRGIALFHK